MPHWTVERVWDQQDVLIIGGGPSLKSLDWSLLKNENTIGCNSAFIHGPEICKICIFGDYRWWVKYETELFEYARKGGTVFTNNQKLFNVRISWLWTMGRESHGLHERTLGWNGNTGASAINLAILLGAKRVFLLGYDMHTINGRSNWHKRVFDNRLVKPSVYALFCKEFLWIKKDWKNKFPEVEIYNVTDDSSLSSDIIPWISPSKFWAGRASCLLA